MCRGPSAQAQRWATEGRQAQCRRNRRRATTRARRVSHAGTPRKPRVTAQTRTGRAPVLVQMWAGWARSAPMQPQAVPVGRGGPTPGADAGRIGPMWAGTGGAHRGSPLANQPTWQRILVLDSRSQHGFRSAAARARCDDAPPSCAAGGESRGTHMVLTWYSHGTHMVLTWCSHGTHKVLPRERDALSRGTTRGFQLERCAMQLEGRLEGRLEGYSRGTHRIERVLRRDGPRHWAGRLAEDRLLQASEYA